MSNAQLPAGPLHVGMTTSVRHCTRSLKSTSLLERPCCIFSSSDSVNAFSLSNSTVSESQSPTSVDEEAFETDGKIVDIVDLEKGESGRFSQIILLQMTLTYCLFWHKASLIIK